MIVICCVCKVTIKVTDKDKGVISHGYCAKCLAEFRKENGLKSC
jgi:hypothetical protein